MLARLLLMAVLALVAPDGTIAAPTPVADAPILVVGDSISAAYGLPSGKGWVDLLAARIKERGYPQRVVNASISGDTTAGGRARLPALLAQHKPGVVVVELGGNDGLRGGSLKATRENLDAMLAAIDKAGAKPLVIGMKLPPNYGPSYTRDFEEIYTSVAAKHKVPLVPYFFAGFGERNDMFQSDRIHPTLSAQQLLLDNVWPTIEPLLGKRR